MKWLSRRKQLFLGILIGIMLASSIGVYAVTKYNANEVEYKENKNVEDALNELYNKCEIRNRLCEEPSIPNLNDNLIPVKILNSGTVKYADINKKWYDYCSKEWANAIMLIDNPSKSYAVGDTIKEEDIRGYFVWIPKYKYRLWNVSTTNPTRLEHIIEIVFDEENTTDIEGVSCVTPMTAGNSGNCNDGEYMTHPAFISMNVNGFWVGKFEPTGTIDNITVKPGLPSIRNQTVKTFFESLYNYSRENNSHMMKNTEWGAVAYLSHSKFGIEKEINPNNNSDFITGSSSLPNKNQNSYPGENGNTSDFFAPYNTEIGYQASTTGNISGVYDMRGGSEEYLAGYRKNTYMDSGFNSSTIGVYDSKFFDVYPSDSEWTPYQNRILGDATGEMGPFISKKFGALTWSPNINKWYSDYSYFVDYSNAWVERGGRYSDGALSGQFCFARQAGAANENFSSRLILSP